MGFGMFNAGIIQLSILILIAVCFVLVVFVLSLAVAYWRLQAKMSVITQESKFDPTTMHDVTGLYTRVQLLDRLEQILQDKGDHVRTALLFFDIDDFNSINTALGLKLGDQVLRQVSHTLTEKVQEFTRDVYHIGSDEFVIILHDCGDKIERLGEIANEIIQSIAQPINIDGYELHISCCAGICVYPDCADNAYDLLKYAGCARDNAKKIGFNSYSYYTEDMSKKSVMRTLIIEELRHALQRNEFVLRYQPIINIVTGKIRGVEALLRWHHPLLGNVTPNVFVPVMEDLGMIHAIGKWVINTACAEIGTLHKRGYTDLSVSINISPHQFNRGDVANIIAESIWESGVAAEQVVLEITEAVVMNDTEKSDLMLKVLQSMGVRIAVDDFGTGYSSLNQLTRFPISILKIDRAFVHDMHLNQTNAAIVRTVLQMAQHLNFTVVAEGVECREELEVLQQYGCQEVQGFYLSKPLSIRDLEILLAQDMQQYIRLLDGKNNVL